MSKSLQLPRYTPRHGSSTPAAAPTPLTDFTPYDAGAIGGVARLGITNGTVIASGAMVFASGVGPLPTGMSPGGDPPYIIPVSSGDRYVWLGFTIDNSDDTNRTATSFYIAKGATLPHSSDDSVFYVPIGDFHVDATTNSITIGSGANGTGSKYLEAWRAWFSYEPVRYNYFASSR